MKDDNLFREFEKHTRKEMVNGVERILIRLINKGYSKEINRLFPPSLECALLKRFSILLFPFSIASYFIFEKILISIGIFIFAVLLYWLSGKIRGGEVIRAILSSEENFRKFQNF